MQLELVNGVEGEGQQLGRTVVNNGAGGGKDKGPAASGRLERESHAYESCLYLLFNKAFLTCANFQRRPRLLNLCRLTFPPVSTRKSSVLMSLMGTVLILRPKKSGLTLPSLWNSVADFPPGCRRQWLLRCFRNIPYIHILTASF